jgi:hypothetical protein
MSLDRVRLKCRYRFFQTEEDHYCSRCKIAYTLEPKGIYEGDCRFCKKQLDESPVFDQMQKPDMYHVYLDYLFTHRPMPKSISHLKFIEYGYIHHLRSLLGELYYSKRRVRTQRDSHGWTTVRKHRFLIRDSYFSLLPKDLFHWFANRICFVYLL